MKLSRFVVAGLCLVFGVLAANVYAQSESEATTFCADVPEDAGADNYAQTQLSFAEAEFVIEPDVYDYYACMVTSDGVIELTLFDDEAPESVNNFVFLSTNSFYDGVVFHRVVDDFVVQGGDRNSPIVGQPMGTGGAGYTWSLEEGATDLEHGTGTLAQARAQSPDSNGSQFYITLSPQPNLDGQYNVYGQVSGEGDMDVVEIVQQGSFIRTVQIVQVDTETGEAETLENTPAPEPPSLGEFEPTDVCADVSEDAGTSEQATEILEFESAESVIDSEASDYYACMVTSKGMIEITLFDDEAPETVNNFVFLAQEGFYDGVLFHRVVDEFVIQGGDRNGGIMGAPGTSGPGYNWDDEPSALELPHSGEGVLSMANAGPNTNGSQFFITHVETPWLNGRHAVFGIVTGEDDMDVVNAVEQGDLIRMVVIVAVDPAEAE